MRPLSLLPLDSLHLAQCRADGCHSVEREGGAHPLALLG